MIFGESSEVKRQMEKTKEENTQNLADDARLVRDTLYEGDIRKQIESREFNIAKAKLKEIFVHEIAEQSLGRTKTGERIMDSAVFIVRGETIRLLSKINAKSVQYIVLKPSKRDAHRTYVSFIYKD
jgi:hypothetical protein